MKRIPLLTGLLVVMAAGCPSKPPPTGPPVDPSLAHIGVWHGTGLAFPAGELCLVFCPNTKLFAADTNCGDLTHADFSREWSWDRTADGLLIARTPQGEFPMQFRPQASAEALFDLVGHAGLPMSRIELLSPLCMQP